MAKLETLGPRGWPLDRLAAGLGTVISKEATEGLGEWLDRLTEWNARVDLTAARGTDELVDLMVADALVLARLLPDNVRVVDVGTGAGAPGLGLAILRPDLDMTLVEPLRKRGAFLRTVLGTLNRLDVKLEGANGETIADAHAAAWDVALARATLPPADWLALASRLVTPSGSAWVFLAREASPSAPQMNEMETHTYKWPLTGADRRLVRYAKEGVV